MGSITFSFLKLREAVLNKMSQKSWKSPKGGGVKKSTFQHVDYFEMRGVVGT